MNKIILVDLVDLVALGFLFGPQDILGQKRAPRVYKCELYTCELFKGH